jgi:hypothetical protein
MDRDTTERLPQPTDPTVDDLEGSDESASSDTEGHSMVSLDLARIIASERVQDGERASRDAARVREARPDRAGSSREGGFLKRFGRR